MERRPQKLGLVWSVLLSFEGNDRESSKENDNVSQVGGGPKTFLGRVLQYAFPPPPPELSTPHLPLSEFSMLTLFCALLRTCF